jgi:hypothetical protein
MKKLLIILVAAASLVASSAFAIESSLGSEYVFHLYFDNSKLVADRDYQFPYDVLGIPYEQPPIATGFPYHAEIVSLAGETVGSFKFDPRNGNANFSSGKVSVYAPYVSDAKQVVFYDPQNTAVLTIPVNQSSFCNDDGICNEDRGETYQTCQRDCKATSLPVPSTNDTTSPPPASSASTSGLVLGVIFMLLGVVLIGGVWWFMRKKSSTPMPPPTSGNPL